MYLNLLRSYVKMSGCMSAYQPVVRVTDLHKILRICNPVITCPYYSHIKCQSTYSCIAHQVYVVTYISGMSTCQILKPKPFV